MLLAAAVLDVLRSDADVRLDSVLKLLLVDDRELAEVGLLPVEEDLVDSVLSVLLVEEVDVELLVVLNVERLEPVLPVEAVLGDVTELSL